MNRCGHMDLLKKEIDLIIYFLADISVSGMCLAQTDLALINSQADETVHPPPYYLYGAKYPQIEADGLVSFHFNASSTKKVQVSIANVTFDLVKGDDGVWTYTSESKEKGYHNYWMLVDSARVLEPTANAFIGYSHMCNGFEVPDPDGGFYALKDVPHGSVLIENYFSNAINSWRHIFVHTPPEYDAITSTRYPELYLQHDDGEDEVPRSDLCIDHLEQHKEP
jgi:hypothetical protein